jgi:alpha-galactosidase
MSSPKVVIIGAGSLFFGRKAIWQMVHSPHLQNGTLALVDTDADRLAKMKKLAEMVIANNRVPLKLEASTDHRDVLKGADFVVLSFAYRNAHYRGVDCEISAKYRIRMCSGDTIGPGGVFRTLREFPHVVQVCQDVQKLCPEAWVINYINPTAVHGIGVKRFFPKLKSFALCDAQWNLRKLYASNVGVPNDEKLTIQTAGPNHFTWLLKAEYDGKDILPQVIQSVRTKAEDINQQAQGGSSKAKGWHNNRIAIELFDCLGALPTVTGHTKEYVRYYQGLGVLHTERTPSLKLFEVPDRITWTNQVWQRVDDYIAGRVPISEFDTEFGPDPATDVIETMWGGLKKNLFVNTFNNGAITNMANDAFIELACDLDMNGPRPLPVGAMPRGIRGMCENILDTHELTAEAAYHSDRTLLRRALLCDPLTNSIADTEALMAEMLQVQCEALSPKWYQ